MARVEGGAGESGQRGKRSNNSPYLLNPSVHELGVLDLILTTDISASSPLEARTQKPGEAFDLSEVTEHSQGSKPGSVGTHSFYNCTMPSCEAHRD